MKPLLTTIKTITTKTVIINQTVATKITQSYFSMAVYVPNLDRDGKLYSTHKFWCKYFQNLFTNLFSGCEQYEVTGSYRNYQGVSYQEITKVIESDLFEINESFIPFQIIHIVKQHITLFAICAAQECVKIKINGQSYLIKISSNKQ